MDKFWSRGGVRRGRRWDFGDFVNRPAGINDNRPVDLFANAGRGNAQIFRCTGENVSRRFFIAGREGGGTVVILAKPRPRLFGFLSVDFFQFYFANFLKAGPVFSTATFFTAIRGEWTFVLNIILQCENPAGFERRRSVKYYATTRSDDGATNSNRRRPSRCVPCVTGYDHIVRHIAYTGRCSRRFSFAFARARGHGRRLSTGTRIVSDAFDFRTRSPCAGTTSPPSPPSTVRGYFDYYHHR